MNPERNCPRCGQLLPSDAPAGRCPKCLVELALKAAAAETAMPTLAGSQPAPVHPPSAVGIRVKYFGDYELVEEIARGGMGVVWKARQLSLNRPVALKMILAGKFASDADVKRFHTEAEAAANLQHPNIVAIHEVGQHDGQHYFSMDYVEGKNLAELVRDGPLPAAKAATLVKTIAEAIHYAHQRGTLHRDLKPSNVLMDASGQPRITDFGLAKRFGVPPSGGSGGQIPAEAGTPNGLTQTGAVMGSPSYMSPEQAAAKHDLVGPPSDVYSLGAILYELLTGRPPFRGTTPMETLIDVLEDEPPNPKGLNPRVPSALETICLKCLEKKPERRFYSALELAQEISRFLKGEPILSRPTSLIRKAWNWVWRHPEVVLGLVLLQFLGLIWLSFGLWAQNRFLLWERLQPHSPKTEYGGLIGLPMHAVGIFLFAWFVAMIVIRMLFQRDSRKKKRLGCPMSPGWLYGYAFLGAVGLFTAFFWVIYYIDSTLPGNADWYWAGSFAFFLPIALVYGGVGVLILLEAFREYRSSMLRSSSEAIAELREQEQKEKRDALRRNELPTSLALSYLILGVAMSVIVACLGTKLWMPFLISLGVSGLGVMSLEHAVRKPSGSDRFFWILGSLVAIGVLGVSCSYRYGSAPILSALSFYVSAAVITALVELKVVAKLSWTDRSLYRLLVQIVRHPEVRIMLLLKDRAERGDAQSQANLGLAYLRGDRGPADEAEAAKWFRAAAEQGLADAQFNLGALFAEGVGVPLDRIEAFRWLSLAAAQKAEFEPYLHSLANTLTSDEIIDGKARVKTFQGCHR